MLHGTSAALHHFKKEFPELKWSTANDWKNAVIKQKMIEASREQKQVDASRCHQYRKRTVAHGCNKTYARSGAIKKNRLQAHDLLFKIVM